MADGNQLCTVVAKPHPFDCDTVYCEFKAGQTIAAMLGGEVSNTTSVSCGGYPVPREAWAYVRPKAGVTLHVVMYPQGGGARKWVRLVAMAVLTYFTAGIATGAYGAILGVSSAGGLAAVAAGAMLVGSLAINALVPPPTQKGLGGAGGDPFQQLNSVTGTSNQANPNGVIPCVVGTKRFFPPHAALPYTEISGDDQYLRMLLDLGYGDLDISDIKIGETDIASFTDVDYEIGTNPSLFAQDIYELAVGVALNATSDTATRTTQTASREISLDIVFSGGLFGIDNKGKTVTGTTSFTIQYRAVGAGTWIDATTASGLTMTGGFKTATGSFSISSTKRKTLRAGIRWTVSSGQYDVRVTRGASTYPNAQDGGTVGDAVWSVLRSVNPQVPSTTGTTKLAVRIKATDQLNGVVSTLSVLASQKIRGIDADTFTDTTATATTNPAWIYLWLLTQCPAVARRVADSRVDLAGIVDWAAECEAKGFAIGFVMDQGRALGDVLRDTLAAGRASFGLRNGLYSAVRDLPQTVPVQMFTPANSWGFNYSRSFLDPPHALRVKFTNPEANDQQDIRMVYADGYTEANATKFEELDLSMVIDPDAAWRLGRYHLSVIYNRMTQYQFQADIEHMVCERGDLVYVAHDVIGWGVAWGRVKAVSGSTVTLDGPVTLESGKTYQFRVRKDDLVQDAVTITTAAGFRQVLDLVSAITGMQPGDLYEVGEVSHGIAPLIVRAVEPAEDFTATLTCVDAAPDVLTADSGTPPIFVSDITGKAWCAAPAPPVVTIRAGDAAPDDAGIIHAVTGISGGSQGGIYRLPIYKRNQL